MIPLYRSCLASWDSAPASLVPLQERLGVAHNQTRGACCSRGGILIQATSPSDQPKLPPNGPLLSP
jgi:hypothetical protein